jgi:hypothetical protein
MKQYRAFAPRELLFMATHGVAPDPAITSGPAAQAQTTYFTNLERAHVLPSYLASLAWDPASIVVDGLRKLGTNATSEQLHKYITDLHGWSGINGVYDFRGSQRGIGQGAVVTYRWDGLSQRFVIVQSTRRAK